MKIPSLIIVLSLSTAAAFGAEVRVTRGTAYVKKAQSARWASVRGKGRVEPGDSLRTGSNSLARVRTKGGHTVYVQARTTIESVSEDGKDTQFKVLVGRIRAFVQKLRPANKFEVRTPVAAAAVRGTTFDIDVAENQSSRLSVLEGAVNYRDLAGLAKEIEVLKGQTMVVVRGQAPRPPEAVPRDMMRGAMPNRERVRREIFVEKRIDDRRESFQEGAAEGQKKEQYQLGRAAVDAFGRRVRIEEFILRPAPESYAYVVVNHREGRRDFSRLDVVANLPLPPSLAGLNLYSKNGISPMGFWAKSTHYLASNGLDYYREWRSGGVPVLFNVVGRGDFREVVFDHWFVEVMGAGQTPVLLSHWVPELGFKAGSYETTKTRDQLDAFDSGALDQPWGYKNHDKHGDALIGDDKASDSLSLEDRFNYFTDPGVRYDYEVCSEGFRRESELMEGPGAINVITPSERVIVQNHYLDAIGSPLATDLRVESFRVTPEGGRLSFEDFSQQVFNVQRVYHSSEFGSRNIDLIYSPFLKPAMGGMDDGFSKLPEGY